MTKEASPIRIQKGVEMPPVERVVRDSKYPFSQMEAPTEQNGATVFDSFFVAGAKASAIHACVSRYKKGKGEGKNFTVRSVVEDGVEGVRVWRTE